MNKFSLLEILEELKKSCEVNKSRGYLITDMEMSFAEMAAECDCLRDEAFFFLDGFLRGVQAKEKEGGRYES